MSVLTPTCCKLSLHLLEDRVLGCGLGPTSKRLGSSAGEHGGNIRDVLQSDTKGADQLLDKVQRVRRDLGVGHGAALLKGHGVAFSQALLELPQDLQRAERGSQYGSESGVRQMDKQLRNGESCLFLEEQKCRRVPKTTETNLMIA